MKYALMKKCYQIHTHTHTYIYFSSYNVCKHVQYPVLIGRQTG